VTGENQAKFVLLTMRQIEECKPTSINKMISRRKSWLPRT